MLFSTCNIIYWTGCTNQSSFIIRKTMRNAGAETRMTSSIIKMSEHDLVDKDQYSGVSDILVSGNTRSQEPGVGQ